MTSDKKKNSKASYYPMAMCGIMILFFGIMTVVALTANGRRSGKTGLDAAKMQITRLDANNEVQE